MKTYFAYTRVSTAKQGEHGSSLREQKSAIEAYAARNQLLIEAWYEERETAAKQGRRMFNRMLGELRRGKAIGVIIHKIDRSARNLKDWAHLGELIDSGIDVHFAHESVDLASRGGRLSADIQAVVAADYIRNLRDEVKKGFYGRLKQGFYPLPAPPGYRNEGRGRPKSVDPVKGPLIRQLFALYDSGRYSIRTLGTEMHERGLRQHNGLPLSANGISLILHNPFYAGLIRLKRTGETFQGSHVPLISMVLFKRVEARLAGRMFPHIVRHGFLYRRLIRCATCSHSLTGERQKGHVYYRCHSPSCRGVSVREEQVDAAVRRILSALALSGEDLRDLRDIAEGFSRSHAEDAEREQAELSRQLGLCESRLSRLTDAFLDGQIDNATFQTRKTVLLEERLSLLERKNAPPEEPAALSMFKKFELANTAYLGFELQNDDEKRETVKFAISNLSARGKSLEVEAPFPLSALVHARGVPTGEPHCAGLRTPDAPARVRDVIEQLTCEKSN